MSIVPIPRLASMMAAMRAWTRGAPDPDVAGTLDPPDLAPMRLTEAELTDILRRCDQTMNVGVADLARLIDAARRQVESRRAVPLTAADVMSRDLVGIDPETPLDEVADLLYRRGLASLPVSRQGDKFVGMIFQIDMIRWAREDAPRFGRGYTSAMARLVDPAQGPGMAGDIIEVAGPRATLGTPVRVIIALMADARCDAIPVLVGGKVVGIVRRANVIAALARESSRLV